MQRSRFVRRLLLGFGLLVGLMMTIAALALADLGVASTNAGALQARLSDRLDRVERLRAAAEEAMLAERALLLTHDDGYRARRADALARYDGLLADLGRDADAWERPELAALRQTAQLHERNADVAVASGRESVALLSSSATLRRNLDEFVSRERVHTDAARAAAERRVHLALWTVVIATVLAAACAIAVAAWFHRLLLVAFDAEQRAAEEARAAVRQREDVLAIVSHDLRSPLHTITGAGGMLRACADEPERVARIAGVVERAALRMDRMIQDLLDATRIGEQRLSIQRAPCSVHELVDAAFEAVEHEAEDAGIALEVDAPDEDVVIQADRGRLLQALLNLVGNALKFTPRGGTIRIDVEVEPDVIALVVEDDGPGIDPKLLPELFTRFRQARPDRRGLGLGLYIARGLVEAHGGEITVESQPGHGTTFRVTLPREAPASETPAHP